MKSQAVSPEPLEIKQIKVNNESSNLSGKEEKKKPKVKSKLILLNVQGAEYKVPLNTFDKLPESRLGRIKTFLENPKGSASNVNELCDKYDSKTNTFYFDRDPKAFNLIINFFNSGTLHVVEIGCGYFLSEELEYWQIGDEWISDCCREKYHQIIEDIDEKIKEEEKIIKKYQAENNFGKRCLPKARAKGWEILESKETRLSKAFFTFSFLMWLLIVFTIILETISNAMTSDAYWNIGYLVVSFFALELILRIVFCPSRLKFFLDPLHLIDFICITQDLIFIALISTTSTSSVIGNGQNNNNGGGKPAVNSGKSVTNNDFQVKIGPAPGPSGSSPAGPAPGPGPAPPGGGPVGGVTLSTATSEALQKYHKIFRFFYIFKIFRYFSSLKILAYAIIKGWKALLLYLSYLLVGGLIFATFVYYAENFASDMNDYGNSKFTSITMSFWWAIITMCTVGYGDISPTSVLGKIIASFAAIFGIIMLAMPVGLLSNSFQQVYSQQKLKKGVIERYKEMRIKNESIENEPMKH